MTDKKCLYFDLETTGLSSIRNGIIQFAGIMDINDETVDELNIRIAPFPDDVIDEEALEVTGVKEEELRTFTPPIVAFEKIKGFLSKHVDPYNKEDKFWPSGYNVSFDLDFLPKFWEKNGDRYFGSFCNWRRLDPMLILYFKSYTDGLVLPDFKLETVCKHYGIELNAHDALSDVRATRELMRLFLNKSN